MAAFDPYHIWLGIPPEDQPPSHYRLLGIPELESNPDVIDGAAEQRTIYLRTFQAGDQTQLAEQLLNEVSAARVCLLNTDQKAEYDQQLQVETQPALVPIPALVQNDPLGIAALQTTPAVPQPSRRTQPIWQQPRMLAAAGGLVAMILLVAVLNSGRDKPNPIRNPKEPATAKRGKNSIISDNNKEQAAAAKAAADTAAMKKPAAEQAAIKSRMGKGAQLYNPGLRAGQSVFAFNVLVITGQLSGKKLSFLDRQGNHPVVVIFARSINDQLGSLLKQVDLLIEKNESIQLKAFVVILTTEPDSAASECKTLARKYGIKNVAMTIFDGHSGPPSFKLNPAADTTMVMYERLQVQASHGLGPGAMTEATVRNVIAEIHQAFK